MNAAPTFNSSISGPTLRSFEPGRPANTPEIHFNQPTKVDARPSVYAIGSSKQTSINNFKAPVSKQIETLQQVLRQFSGHELSDKLDQETTAEAATAGQHISGGQLLEGVWAKGEVVSGQVKKQSQDVFGALKDLFFEDIGFKHLTKEQQEQRQAQQQKEQAQNVNKKSFYDALSSAKLAFENMMMKLLNELQDRLGISGKSLAEKNALLGTKARNLSYAGVNTPYHIKAMHDALIEQERLKKLQESKQAAPMAGKKKVNYFMDKNSALSRQGQSVYSAAG